MQPFCHARAMDEFHSGIVRTARCPKLQPASTGPEHSSKCRERPDRGGTNRIWRRSTTTDQLLVRQGPIWICPEDYISCEQRDLHVGRCASCDDSFPDWDSLRPHDRLSHLGLNVNPTGGLERVDPLATEVGHMGAAIEGCADGQKGFRGELVGRIEAGEEFLDGGLIVEPSQGPKQHPAAAMLWRLQIGLPLKPPFVHVRARWEPRGILVPRDILLQAVNDLKMTRIARGVCQGTSLATTAASGGTTPMPVGVPIESLPNG